jgi:hypothetical protein
MVLTAGIDDLILSVSEGKRFLAQACYKSILHQSIPLYIVIPVRVKLIINDCEGQMSRNFYNCFLEVIVVLLNFRKFEKACLEPLAGVRFPISGLETRLDLK